MVPVGVPDQAKPLTQHSFMEVSVIFDARYKGRYLFLSTKFLSRCCKSGSAFIRMLLIEYRLHINVALTKQERG